MRSWEYLRYSFDGDFGVYVGKKFEPMGLDLLRAKNLKKCIYHGIVMMGMNMDVSISRISQKEV